MKCYSNCYYWTEKLRAILTVERKIEKKSESIDGGCQDWASIAYAINQRKYYLKM